MSMSKAGSSLLSGSSSQCDPNDGGDEPPLPPPHDMQTPRCKATERLVHYVRRSKRLRVGARLGVLNPHSSPRGSPRGWRLFTSGTPPVRAPRPALMAHRGAQLATQARQQLQARLNAVEGEGTSPLGRASGGPGTGAVTLSAAELRALVSDAVETALAARASADTHADAQREHDEGAPPALGAFMQEVRAFITTAQAVGTPGSNTIVLKKAKRYELGASTSREKVRA